MSKCTGHRVSSNWENEIVNFNPYPHHYNTLNLPSWESQDSPIPNNNRVASNCPYHKDYSDFNAANIPIINTMVMRSTGKWGIQNYLGPVIQETKNYDHGWLYYGGNALHWDNNGRGALNLYSDQSGGFNCAFQLGNVDTKWHTQGPYRLDLVNRWMPAVYGLQFEWDSGIHYPDINGHPHDDTNTATKGYRIKSLIMHYTMTDNNGNVLSDFALTLVKNSLIPPGICYWYEGYSLVDTITWKDQDKGQGYKENGQPMRKGKCGFAIDSKALGFELIRNCAVTQDGKRYHYIKNHQVDASDLSNNNIDELGAQMIWRSTYFAFEGNGSDTNAKKKNFRLWNCKPITVPVTYADPSNTHCHPTYPEWDDEFTDDEDDRYQPYNNRSVAVVHDTSAGGPQSASMKEVVPGLGDIRTNGYKYLYTSKELRKRRDDGDLHTALENEIRGRSSLPLAGKPDGFDSSKANYQNQGVPAAGESGWKDS